MKTFTINGQTLQGTGGSIAAVKRFFAANDGKPFTTILAKDDGNVWAPGIRWIRKSVAVKDRFFGSESPDLFTGPMSMLVIDSGVTVIHLTDTQVVMRDDDFKHTVTYTIVSE